jgi:hypothetical protein
MSAASRAKRSNEPIVWLPGRPAYTREPKMEASALSPSSFEPTAKQMRAVINTVAASHVGKRFQKPIGQHVRRIDVVICEPLKLRSHSQHVRCVSGSAHLDSHGSWLNSRLY